MLLILILICLLKSSKEMQVIKTYQVCTQPFNVELLRYLNQKQFGFMCRNEVDYSEPIQIYNVVSQKKKSLDKNKTEILSSLNHNREAKNLLIGSHNSSIYIYDQQRSQIIDVLRVKQSNIIINGAIYLQENNIVVSIGNNGQVCAISTSTKNILCTLAHSFEVHVISSYQNYIVTCGGDRTCKYWFISQNIGVKITLVKTVLLSRISKVTTIMASSRRVVVGGAEGFQTLPNISKYYPMMRQKNLRSWLTNTNSPIQCGIIEEKWNRLLTADGVGNLLIYDLSTNSVVSRQNLGEKITSCQFVTSTYLITGHARGLVKLWQI